MSKKQYIQTLYHQINRLNAVIDRKIVLGKAYRAEARQHKMILHKIRKCKNPGVFDKITSLFHREYA